MSDVSCPLPSERVFDLELLKIAFTILEHDQERRTAHVSYTGESAKQLVNAARRIIDELYEH